jgi:glycosyltransferase involved in cell wall biosynthesis
MVKKKLGLFLASRPQDGGAYQYSLSILTAISALPRDKYEIVMLYTNEKWGQYVNSSDFTVIFQPIHALDHFAVKCLKVGLLPTKFWNLLSARISKIAKLLIEQQCNLWVFPSQDEWTYFAPIPALTAIHDLMHRYEPQFPEVSAYHKYARRELHYKKLCEHTAGLLVDSDVGRQHVIASYNAPEQRIHVLPFIAPDFIYSQTNADDLHSKYKLPRKFMFYPAQFWKHKNHERLLRAVASLVNEIPDIALVLVGSRKNNYNTVHKLANELGVQSHVHFLSYVPSKDIPHLYRQARAMIMPTFFGPTNIPPLEAFATGCPTAVSKIYAMPEQVGDAALLFDPNSTEEIAHAMKSLWLDDRLCRDLAKKGKDRDKHWNQNQFNQRFHDIIDNVIQRRTRNSYVH